MKLIKTIKDKLGNTIYPQTLEKCVWDDNGVRLDNKLSAKANISDLTGKVSIGNDYRPNLLVNGDFRINSQCKTTYTTGGNIFDKWLYYGTSAIGTVEKTSSGIKITSPGTSDSFIIQHLQDADINIKNLTGKKLTLSMCDVNDVIYSGTGLLSATSSSAGVTCNYPNGYMYFNNTLDGYIRAVLVINQSATLSIKWVKLEVNDHSTPFIQKSYKEELLACSDNIGYTPNLLINGDFQVWQRGEIFDRSSTTGRFYTADRWCALRESYKAGAVVVRDGEYLKVTNPNDGHATFLTQPIESSTGKKLRNKTITLSAKIKSSISGIMYANIWYTNNGEYFPGQTAVGCIVTKLFPISTEFSTIQVTGVVPYDAQGMLIEFYYDLAGDITFEYVKLEVNDHATSFIPRSYGEELALCQRYFQLLQKANSDSGYYMHAVTTLITSAKINYQVPMRIKPTLVKTGSAIYDGRVVTVTANGDSTISAITNITCVLYATETTCAHLQAILSSGSWGTSSIGSMEYDTYNTDRNLYLDAEI